MKMFDHEDENGNVVQSQRGESLGWTHNIVYPGGNTITEGHLVWVATFAFSASHR